MINFIIPLKSRAVSSNWGEVCRLFEITLGSVCGQTDPDFRVTVVCHDRPQLQQESRFDGCVEWMEVDFALPDRKAPQTLMADKYRKLAVGFAHARALQPDFTMIVDADDLVSNRLAAHANAHRGANGWSVHRGYVFDYENGYLLRQPNFHQVCGTSAIVSTRTFEFPDAGDFGDSEVFARARQQCALLTNGHQTIERYMAERGTPLAPLPFAGAIYVLGHGDNYVRTHVQGPPEARVFRSLAGQRLSKAKRVLSHLPRRQALTFALRQEFGMPDFA